MKKIIAFAIFLIGPLTPAAAFTPVGGTTPNAYMVENTSGTDTSGNFCYDFQTKPTCLARITNLTATVSSGSIPSGSTNYIQNTLTPTTTTQVFNVSSGTIHTLVTDTITLNTAFLLGGSAGAAGQAVTSNGPGVAPSYQATGAGILNSTNTWTGGNTFISSTTFIGTFINAAVATTSVSSSTTSNTYAMSGITAQITPKSTAHHILILVTCDMQAASSTGVNYFITLFRGTTNIGDASTGLATWLPNNTGVTARWPLALTKYDTPATTSLTTYTVGFKNSDNSTAFSIPSANVPLCSIVLLEV